MFGVLFELLIVFFVKEMLIWNRCYIQLRHFLFLPERGEFAAVFTPSIWQEGASFSCECGYRRSSLRHGGVGSREWFGIGPKSCLPLCSMSDRHLCWFLLVFLVWIFLLLRIYGFMFFSCLFIVNKLAFRYTLPSPHSAFGSWFSPNLTVTIHVQVKKYSHELNGKLSIILCWKEKF